MNYKHILSDYYKDIHITNQLNNIYAFSCSFTLWVRFVSVQYDYLKQLEFFSELIEFINRPIKLPVHMLCLPIFVNKVIDNKVLTLCLCR